MIPVISLTQFAFLSLGIMSLLVQARTAGRTMEEIFAMPQWWLLMIPLAWVALAVACSRVKGNPLPWKVARVTGVILAVLSFVFLVAATFSNGS